jgi:hypothetical protein
VAWQGWGRCCAHCSGCWRPWRLAADGMTIDLPAGSAEIRFGAL